ncbi:hypothetical protein DPMN_184965 [Dreissena polymorpha]|uniref:Uncharacterized protein n=1 Tax=Dreissena polymorpha TaxID=45954 RepID=A0A9D4DLV3_DREPO|nr:hypothetical protein DPMN_184965 [Dreissena polymorpha]
MDTNQMTSSMASKQQTHDPWVAQPLGTRMPEREIGMPVASLRTHAMIWEILVDESRNESAWRQLRQTDQSMQLKQNYA